MAARARHIKLHAVRALLDGAFSLALRTYAGLLDHSVAVTIRARVLARDVQAHDAAANRRPEGNVHLVFKIAAGLRAFLSDAAAPTAKNA